MAAQIRQLQRLCMVLSNVPACLLDQPGARTERFLRPAAPAGPEAGLFSGTDGREKNHLAAAGPAGRTSRTAVNPCRTDRINEPPIKIFVPPKDGVPPFLLTGHETSC